MVLRRDHDVDPAIVVEVSNRQASSHEWKLEPRPRAVGHVDELASCRRSREKLRPHLLLNVGAIILDVAIGGDQIESAVVVEVEKSHPEAEPVAACHRDAAFRGMVAEETVAEIDVERCVFVVVVGDGQVGQAVAVGVANAARPP